MTTQPQTAAHQMAITDEVMISLAGVNKWYGQFHVLKDIDLTVMKGERIVIRPFDPAVPSATRPTGVSSSWPTRWATSRSKPTRPTVPRRRHNTPFWARPRVPRPRPGRRGGAGRCDPHAPSIASRVCPRRWSATQSCATSRVAGSSTSAKVRRRSPGGSGAPRPRSSRSTCGWPRPTPVDRQRRRSSPTALLKAAGRPSSSARRPTS